MTYELKETIICLLKIFFVAIILDLRQAKQDSAPVSLSTYHPLEN